MEGGKEGARRGQGEGTGGVGSVRSRYQINRLAQLVILYVNARKAEYAENKGGEGFTMREKMKMGAVVLLYSR